MVAQLLVQALRQGVALLVTVVVLACGSGMGVEVEVEGLM